jgi:hypothetical protein
MPAYGGRKSALVLPTSSIYTPCPWVVPIIPLPGITLPDFASRHAAAWFHISPEKRCYQTQVFTLHKVSRVIYIKRSFSISNTPVSSIRTDFHAKGGEARKRTILERGYGTSNTAILQAKSVPEPVPVSMALYTVLRSLLGH